MTTVGIHPPTLNKQHVRNVDKLLSESFRSAPGCRESCVAGSVISSFPPVIMKHPIVMGKCVYSDSCFKGKVYLRVEGMVTGVLLGGVWSQSIAVKKHFLLFSVQEPSTCRIATTSRRHSFLSKSLWKHPKSCPQACLTCHSKPSE